MASWNGTFARPNSSHHYLFRIHYDRPDFHRLARALATDPDAAPARRTQISRGGDEPCPPLAKNAQRPDRLPLRVLAGGLRLKGTMTATSMRRLASAICTGQGERGLVARSAVSLHSRSDSGSGKVILNYIR